MKFWQWILAFSVMALMLSSCGTSSKSGSPGPQAVTGPFDRNGNYVEEWADNPSKWRRGSGGSIRTSQPEKLQEIASADEPPANSVPLQTVSQKPVQTIAQTQVVPKPVVRETQIVEKPTRTIAKAPVKKKTPEVTKKKATPKKESVAKTKSKVVPKKKVIAKTKTKAKPTSTRYTVRRGDSLSAVASRTGSSVSAIKKANGISGSVIRPGQSLKIPK
ncbi:MAG: LysM peptidoglycan-binding domain-containing protein [Akkermansiaceae bacterium]|nr:LysM peptidoglycan-binding domain-containing protein [Akkermansiaceae bacterium]